MATVTDIEFKNRVCNFIDKPLKEPVSITKNGKRILVLIDADELERLITVADNRQSYFVKDLPQDAIKAFERAPQAPARPELDHLVKNS